MMSTSADGEFWIKKSTIPSGMDEDGSDPALDSFCNLAVLSVMDNPYESGFICTLSDFKLHKEVSLSFSKSGISERTWSMRDEGEFVLVWGKTIDKS